MQVGFRSVESRKRTGSLLRIVVCRFAREAAERWTARISGFGQRGGAAITGRLLWVQACVERPHRTHRLRRIDLRSGLDPVRHTTGAHDRSQLRGHADQDQQTDDQREDGQRVLDRIVVLPPGVDDQPTYADERSGRDQRDRRIRHYAVNGLCLGRVQRRLAAPAPARGEGAAA
jgi:hypothetical protein